MRVAIIVGVNGQDGFYLSNLLKQKGYDVVGIDQDTTHPFSSLGSEIFDIRNPSHVDVLMDRVKPDEVYYLAAFHQSSQDNYDESFEILERSIYINEVSLFNFLAAIVRFSSTTRLFYAASSHIFGEPAAEIQNENTPINPVNLYGITKASGVFLCRKFRREHNIFASSGILYNHESLRRKDAFLSKKIINSIIKSLQGDKRKMELGNIEAIVDWGYAPDYVDAINRILLLPRSDDFIVATGIKHTVRDFLEIAYKSVGLDWSEHVIEKKGIVKKITKPLIGDSTKLRNLTDWEPSLTFDEMVKLMVLEAIGNEHGKH